MKFIVGKGGGARVWDDSRARPISFNRYTILINRVLRLIDNRLTFASELVPVLQSDGATRYRPTVQSVYWLQAKADSH